MALTIIHHLQGMLGNVWTVQHHPAVFRASRNSEDYSALAARLRLRVATKCQKMLRNAASIAATADSKHCDIPTNRTLTSCIKCN